MPTHGSLTKAGKVRSQTPKIQGRVRVSSFPRYRVRRNFEKRIVLRREPGQASIGGPRRGGPRRGRRRR